MQKWIQGRGAAATLRALEEQPQTWMLAGVGSNMKEQPQTWVHTFAATMKEQTHTGVSAATIKEQPSLWLDVSNARLEDEHFARQKDRGARQKKPLPEQGTRGCSQTEKSDSLLLTVGLQMHRHDRVQPN
eukprot:1158826-Pelagomonas_calceolata.AAC.3